MPVTKLDPRTALIVIDLQNASLATPREPHPMDEVVRNTGALADAFRHHGHLVVLVKVVGRPAGRTEQVRSAASAQRSASDADFIDDLAPRPGDLVIEKRNWGAFSGTGLEKLLRERGVTQVVVAGCATSIGVESTAREAYSCGLNVTLALDAMSDVSAEAHVNSATRIFPRLGETGMTREIIGLLAGSGG